MTSNTSAMPCSKKFLVKWLFAAPIGKRLAALDSSGSESGVRRHIENQRIKVPAVGVGYMVDKNCKEALSGFVRKTCMCFTILPFLSPVHPFCMPVSYALSSFCWCFGVGLVCWFCSAFQNYFTDRLPLI